MATRTTPEGHIWGTTEADQRSPGFDRDRALNRDARHREVKALAGRAEQVATRVDAKAEAAAAQAKAAAQTVAMQEIRVRGLETAHQLAPGAPADGVTANLLAQPDSLSRGSMDAALTAAVASVNERVDRGARLLPYHYGAVGDGNADDTTALLDWLAAGGTTMEPGRAYRTNRPLDLAGDHRTLNGNHASVIYRGDDSLDARAVRVTGDHATVCNLTVIGDGGGISHGIWVSGAFAKITDNRVIHIHDVAGAQGIHVEGHTGGHLIANNTIHDIIAFGDGVIASSVGLARGIMFWNGPTNEHMKYESIITGNRISSVLGEEGDAIGVLGYSPTTIADGHAKSKLTISNNALDDSSRRAIKVQASEVTVKDNVIRDSVRGNSEFISSVIDVINSKDVTVSGNEIYTGDLRGISASGPDTTMNNLIIRNNQIHIPVITDVDAVGTAIYVNKGFYFNVADNITFGGDRAIAVGGSVAGSVTGNTINRLKAAGANSRAVAIITGNDRVNMFNNTFNKLTAGGGSPVWFQNDSTNGASANNNMSYA